MIKALSFAEDFDDVKYKDTSSALSLLLTTDGAPFNTNNCQSLNIAIANDEGYIMTQSVELSNVDDPNSGVIEMLLDDDIMNKLVPDVYKIEAWATIKPVMVETTPNSATLTVLEDELKSHVAIFPSSGALQFEITDNLMSSHGQAIAMITMQNFEDRFKKLFDDTKNNISQLRGPQGKDAFNVAVDNGYTGTVDEWLKTLVGPQGDKGDTGKQGPKGDPGTGVKIVGQTDSADKLPKTANDADGYLVSGELYTFISGKWIDVGKIQGPQGVKGDKGDPGQQGPKGDTGEQGPKGDTGPAGKDLERPFINSVADETTATQKSLSDPTGLYVWSEA